MSRQIQRDDFLKNRILCNLKTDESQTFGLFTEYTLEKDSNTYKKNIMYLNLDDLSVKQLELSFSVADYYIEKGDIIFKVFSDGTSVFYLFRFGDNLCSPLFTIPFKVEEFRIAKSGFFFTAVVEGSQPISDILCSQRGPFFSEGRGVTGSSIKGLFRSDPGGRNISMISSSDLNISQVDMDVENGQVLFSAFRSEGLKTVESAVYSYDIKTDKITLLFDKPYRIDYLLSMDAGSAIFTGVDLIKNSRNDNQQIYHIDLETGEVDRLGEKLDRSNENVSVVTDSIFGQSLPIQKNEDFIYFKQVERDREILCRISLSGEMEIVLDEMKTISSYTVTDSGVFLIGLKDLRLSEIYFFNGKKLKQVSHRNKWLGEIILSNAEKLTVLLDDVEIDGYVYPPANIEEGKIYPAVLMIHGGPKMLYSDVFAHDIQLLCSEGFYVFNANPMGSDGRGDDFSNIRGHFGDLPYRQLMGFTDKVLERYPLIDPHSLGVTGGSYGGYMTNYIITRTARFKAAVSERGISSLISSFTSSEIGYKYIYEYMGNKDTPWSAPELYMEASPINRADKVTTATLFIHGKDDYTCHYSESLNMYSSLNYLGIETRFCLFENEGHGLVVRGKPLSKLRRYRELITWFNQHLKKGNE